MFCLLFVAVSMFLVSPSLTFGRTKKTPATSNVITQNSSSLDIVERKNFSLKSLPFEYREKLPQITSDVYIRSTVLPTIAESPRKPTTSTQITPAHQPLKLPKTGERLENNIHDEHTLTSMPPPYVWLTNETEYLLEREDAQVNNHGFSSKRRKVKFPQSNHLYWNEINGITMAGIRDQIPRPPRLKRIEMRRQFYEDDEPRPFNYQFDGVRPSEFRKSNSSLSKIPKHYKGKVNNIQDILKQVHAFDENETNKNRANYQNSPAAGSIQISGRYRHPRGRGVDKIFDQISKNPQNQNPLKSSSDQSHLHLYKPKSPNDVNLLAWNQYNPSSSLLQYSPYVPLQSYTPDIENMYHRIIMANNNRQKTQHTSRNGYDKKHKPFSLMLDIYPMVENEHSTISTTQRPQRVKPRKPYLPLPPAPSAVNNLPYSYQLDNSYYNSINFPQLQYNKFQQHSPQSTRNQHNPDVDYYDYHRGGVNHNRHQDSENKPSQIMVHLNLFPKNKNRPYNRQQPHHSLSGTEYDANKRVFAKSPANSVTGSTLSKIINQDQQLEPLSVKTTTANPFENPIVVITEEIFTDSHDRSDEVINTNNCAHTPGIICSNFEPNFNTKTNNIGNYDFRRPYDEHLPQQQNNDFLGNFNIPQHEIIKFQLDDALIN